MSHWKICMLFLLPCLMFTHGAPVVRDPSTLTLDDLPDDFGFDENGLASVFEVDLTDAAIAEGEKLSKMANNPVSRPDPEELYLRRFYEGDINLAPGVSDPNAPKRAANAIRNLGKLWPDGKIPYKLVEDFTFREYATIASAFKEFERETCIRFVPRTNEKDYILITKQDGCWSTVGRAGGRQDVSLHPQCFQSGVGIILHELLHAIGFWHEQSRTDRDNYVIVRYENMERYNHFNFIKYDQTKIQHLGEEYDYGSIMHYGPLAFSVNNRPTIEPRQESYTIGQRLGFSDVDVAKVNKLYCSQDPNTHTDTGIGDAFIREGTQLFGEYDIHVANSAAECHDVCMQFDTCMASMTKKSSTSCWLFGANSRVEREAEDTADFTVYFRGMEKNADAGTEKRAYNYYDLVDVDFPLDCRIYDGAGGIRMAHLGV